MILNEGRNLTYLFSFLFFFLEWRVVNRRRKKTKKRTTPSIYLFVNSFWSDNEEKTDLKINEKERRKSLIRLKIGRIEIVLFRLSWNICFIRKGRSRRKISITKTNGRKSIKIRMTINLNLIWIEIRQFEMFLTNLIVMKLLKNLINRRLVIMTTNFKSNE